MKMKVTKQMIEELAIKMLIKMYKFTESSYNYIYYNNKRIHIENGNIITEENVDPHDYCKYAAYDHVISISAYDFDYDTPEWLFGKMVSKYGLFIECCTSTFWSLFEATNDYEYEYTVYERPEEEKRIYWHNYTDFGNEIELVYETWYESVQKYGVCGSCIIGDGIHFMFKGHPYFMSTNYNQSDSVGKVIEITKAKLAEIGATDVWYDCGRLD